MPSKRNCRWKYLLSAGLFWSVQVHAQTTVSDQQADSLKAHIDQYLDQQRNEHNIPALSIAVINGQLIEYSYARGKQNSDQAIDDSSIFHAASISKLFTATAIMQLVEKQTISLDQPAGDFLPAFQNSGILIRHLLTHQAGLKNRVRPSHSIDRNSHQEYLERATKNKPAYVPGEGWKYNDTDYNLLGAIVKIASNMDFDRYARLNILEPLGMNKSSFYLPDIPSDKIAAPHKGKSAKLLKKYPYDVNFAPSSGLQTNALELALFLKAHLRHDPRLLQKSSYSLMQKIYSSTKWEGIEQGFAWQILTGRNGERILQHGGSDPGYRALVMAYPEEQKAYILLSNGENTPRWEIIASLRKLLGHAK